jgi:imidazolonepropionase-like amidohydrolase
MATLLGAWGGGCGNGPDSAGGDGPGAGATAYVGARLIDGTGAAPVEGATMLVRGGRIEAVGPAAQVEVPAGAARVDLDGKTVMPGIINAHGHISDVVGLESGPEHYTKANIERQLGLYARYGVTTVFSLGGDGPDAFEVRAAQNTPALAQARLFVAGPVVSADDPQRARELVDAIAGTGPDLLKIRVDDNLGTTRKLDQPVWEAIIEEAHSRGLRVAAHVYYLEDARALVVKDVDFIAHSVRNTEVDEGFASILRSKDVCVCPTLTREVSTYVYESTPDFFNDPFFLREADPAVVEQLKAPERQAQFRGSKSGQTYKAQLPVAMRNVKLLSEAGVRLAFGTDTGPVARFQGYFEHMELAMLVEAGLTPMQALVSATGDAARCMRVADRIGTLAPGLEADFLVLGRNPLDDIANTKSLEAVYIKGNFVPGRAN